jgi:hypothetical protein
MLDLSLNFKLTVIEVGGNYCNNPASSKNTCPAAKYF